MKARRRKLRLELNQARKQLFPQAQYTRGFPKKMKHFQLVAALLATLFVYYSNTKLFNNNRNLEQKKTTKRQKEGGSTIVLPPQFSNLVDLQDFFDAKFDKTTVTPFFWHVAKAAGTSVQYYYSQCLTLIIASEIGGSRASNNLEIIKENGVKNHINVDTSTVQGIMHAKELGLAENNSVQLVISPLFFDATNELFTKNNKGVMFAMFRHPVERVISLFYYMQTATHEVTYNPIFANMTIEEYADSNLVESNFITRSLVNKMEEGLSPEDLEMAKEILKRKCLIGLMREFDTSMNLYNEAFQFQPNFSVEIDGEDNSKSAVAEISKKTRSEKCIDGLQKTGGTNKHKHDQLSENSKAFETIERKNYWDLLLWEYIVDLYREQQLNAMERDLGFKGLFQDKA